MCRILIALQSPISVPSFSNEDTDAAGTLMAMTTSPVSHAQFRPASSSPVPLPSMPPLLARATYDATHRRDGRLSMLQSRELPPIDDTTIRKRHDSIDLSHSPLLPQDGYREAEDKKRSSSEAHDSFAKETRRQSVDWDTKQIQRLVKYFK